MKNTVLIAVLAAFVLLCMTGCESGLSSSQDAMHSNTDYTTIPSSSSTNPSPTFVEETVPPATFAEEMIPPTTVAEEVVPMQITVITRMDYSKDVIVAPELESFWEATGLTHNLRIPMIDGNTKAIVAFNEVLWADFSEIYDTLVANEEYAAMYDIDYEFEMHDGLVAILVILEHSVQAGGGSTSCYGYYFDVKADRQLTFEEYLSRFSSDQEDMLERIQSSREYCNITEEMNMGAEIWADQDCTLACCIIGACSDDWEKLEAPEYCVTAWIENPQTMNGGYLFTCFRGLEYIRSEEPPQG